MQPTDILKKLKQCSKSDEGYHVLTFELYRQSSDEQHCKVTVKILDAGTEENPILRYQCIAKTEGGRIALGNTASSIHEAISIVHWDDLDRDR